MHGEYKIPGGKLIVVDLDVIDGALRDVVLSGDFFSRTGGSVGVDGCDA